jgi:hypothetical protein
LEDVPTLASIAEADARAYGFSGSSVQTRVYAMRKPARS